MDARTYADRPSHSNSAEWHLHYGGNSKPIAIIIPDSIWPGMYRIWANDRLSDLGNLIRIKDAAEVMAERGPPHRDLTLFRWKTCLCGRRRASPMRQNGRGRLDD